MSFIENILHLRQGTINSSWGRLLCEAFRLQPEGFDSLPYTLGIALEPAILTETALITGQSVIDLENLQYTSSGPISRLQHLINEIHHTTPLQQLNIVYALASLVRYSLAENIYNQIDCSVFNPETKFHYLRAGIVLASIKNNNKHLKKVFYKLVNLIENFSLPLTYKIASAVLAILASVKNSILTSKELEWFIEMGRSSINVLNNNPVTLDEMGALSSYWRALALLQFNLGKKDEVSQSLYKAEYYVNIMQPRSTFDQDLQNYYFHGVYQALLKEQTHSGNYEAAIYTAKTLIDFDPQWTISYHNAAECYLLQNDYPKALELLLQARRIGMPRLIYTQFMIAYVLEKMERYEESIKEYQQTLALDAGNISSAVNGYLVAKKIKHSQTKYFKNFFNEWSQRGELSEEVQHLIRE